MHCTLSRNLRVGNPFPIALRCRLGMKIESRNNQHGAKEAEEKGSVVGINLSSNSKSPGSSSGVEDLAKLVGPTVNLNPKPMGTRVYQID